jgi:hypothetical protein
MIEDKKSQWHRIKFLALIAVFLSPFVGGWLALYVFEIKPESKNYGSLVQPPLKVNWPVLNSFSGEQYSNGFGRKWTFLLFTRETCTEQCRSNLYYMRQIRTLLGRNTRRLQNVLISAVPIGAELEALLLDYPSLVVIDNFDSEALYSQFQVADMEGVGSTPRLYLVDPDQNYMMHYPAQSDQNRILEDIRKLMKLSQIG